MKPKERASKLKIHYSIILNLPPTNKLVINSSLKAINLLLISVEYENVSDNFYNYWNEVKQEIELL
jgi:hypothetical protein